MEKYKLGEMEYKLACILWENENISTRKLIHICGDEFQWKRTTTYTMLKRLCIRGLFKNNGGIVSVLMTKDEFNAGQGEQFLEESFNGSMPKFLATFTRQRKLSNKEVDEIQKLIDEYRG